MRMILLIGGVVLSAPAQPASSLEERLGQCLAVEQNAARLDCFERVAESVVLTRTTAPDATAGTGSGVGAVSNPDEISGQGVKSEAVDSQPNVIDDGQTDGTTKADEFGLEHRQGDEDEAIFAVVREIGLDAYGKVLFTLSNGQVWLQADSRRVNIAPGQSVSITRGIFNSFFLRGQSMRATIKVRRQL
jgi:hypothetical protein